MPRTIPRVSHRFEPLDAAKPLTARQELYCQAVARGAAREVAYREAGYKGRTNAPRMSRYPNVKARIAQLLAEAAARNPETEIQLRADQAVPYGRVVEVMGVAPKVNEVSTEVSPG